MESPPRTQRLQLGPTTASPTREAAEEMKRNAEEHVQLAQQQAQHSAIIALVLGKASKIHKESKTRRHKDLNVPLLDECVEGLTRFQDVEWPPRRTDVSNLPEWMAESGISADVPDFSPPDLGPRVPERKVSSNYDEDEAMQSHLSDFERAKAAKKKAKEEEEARQAQSQSQQQRQPSKKQQPPSSNGMPTIKCSMSDDQNEDSMHPTVVKSLQAFCYVMRSKSKTPKMCELALDCVTILVTNGYVSGVAGTREVIRKEVDTTSDAGSVASTKPSSSVSSVNSEQALSQSQSQPPAPRQSFLDYLIESISSCSESSFEVVHTAMTKALLALMTASKCGVHEAALLVSVRSTFHVYLVSKSASAKEVSKATLLDMLKAVFNRMEAYDAVTRQSNKDHLLENESEDSEDQDHSSENGTSNNNANANTNGTQPAKSAEVNAFASQYHTDGYLLFRALCKLSAKALPEEEKSASANANAKLLAFTAGGQSMDPLALNSKVLSLELILVVFEHCGEAFRTGDKFIYAVQNYLCVSLLKNCMSVHTDVAFLSLKIFLALVYNFKSHLKSEIEVFVANIFLRVLESPNSSFDQKALVLKALRALCSDPLMLTQLFLNYDCDFDAVDLYKSIVYNLTRVSSKPPTRTVVVSKKDVSEEMALCQAGLEVLVVILRAFLKVLDLPGGDDEIDDSISPLRSSLHLDIGLAVSPRSSPGRGKDKLLEGGGENGEDGEEGGEKEEDVAIYKKDLKTSQERNDDDSSSSGALANKIVDAFDRKRTVQQNFETGVVKFNLSLKGGLLYFIENDFLTLDALDVAVFFHKQKDKLEKTQIGEALGKEPDYPFVKDEGVDAEKGGVGFFVRVLHHYVYAMDFSGLEFDDAIRTLLSGFRLPGEAQKIDRIMEKFAERYTRQNEDVFPSADTAFILAFSVIMLNTDLHNPSIKPEKRMTVESFIRNNRGISVDGGDLPDEYLTGIYNRIQKKPFSLKEDDDARAKERESTMQDTFFVFESRGLFGSSAEDRKREKFRKEREAMMVASEQLFRKRSHRVKEKGGGAQTQMSARHATHSKLAESVSPADVVKPMFDVTWGPLIGTLSQILETTNDQSTINLCLNAFVYSVRIASHSQMSLARDTFINALTKFTTLGSIKEMKYKNIESIQTLLSIAVIDGEFIGESWGPVLQCISHLARLQLFASGLDEDDKFFLTEESQASPTENMNTFFKQPSKDDIARETESNNAQAVLAAVNEILIDKVFSSTVNLTARSMHHFIEQLVNVSAAEISGDLKKGIGVSGSSGTTLAAPKLPASPATTAAAQNGSTGNAKNIRVSSGGNGPRIFSLQKLVEVADYNMDARPRIAWTQMWELMAKHFATIGCHENAMVSMFAIDALRQLSFKFLQKQELYDFNFQRVFLRPFLQIIENPGSREDIRELILRCVDNMIRTLSHNLRSGWKIFFQIIVHSAKDPSEKISTLGLAILQRLLDEHLEELCGRYCVDGYQDGNVSGTEDPDALTPLQRRIRNASAEDFVGLCHASMSFVQTQEEQNPLPIGLSMRAICHTACYADLIADNRVLPPVSSQSTDPEAFAYTYDGLSDDEAKMMVLWRPILDGLAAGICSTAKSNSGGVGCLVQRGSVMTLRAILLRHGTMFTINQWSVILKNVILPAIQRAAEYDESPVVFISSESPSVSSLDFLAEPLPLPPPAEDPGLQKFASKAQSEETAPSRPLGPSELLVEASFADLRHGGDGDLSRAHGLSKKNFTKKTQHEQPFPDSWVATTAPISLGMLTDIVSQYVLGFGKEGRETLWPLVVSQYQLWVLGPPVVMEVPNDTEDEDDISVLDDDHYFDPLWRPCEALARIGCREARRMVELVEKCLQRDQGNKEMAAWCIGMCLHLSTTLKQDISLEGLLRNELIEFRSSWEDAGKTTNRKEDNVAVGTPYGRGQVIRRRVDLYDGYDGSNDVAMWEVALEWGAKLFGPEIAGAEEEASAADSEAGSEGSDEPVRGEDSAEMNEQDNVNDGNMLSREEILSRFVPALKVRCIVAHLVQQDLRMAVSSFIRLISEDDIKEVFASLNESREFAAMATADKHLSDTFTEVLNGEWGDDVLAIEGGAPVGSKSKNDQNRGGSAMFFLTQQAGANRTIIHILSLFYSPYMKFSTCPEWDRSKYAEPILMERMQDILLKFLASEKKDGHLVDPNVWQKPGESGGNVPLYCTIFAGAVVNILKTMLKFTPSQFSRQVKVMYPILCSLIRVQSNEIRNLVSDILLKKVEPLIDCDLASRR